MSKWSYMILENFQDVSVDESGSPVVDEDGTPIYVDVWTDGENEFEGELTDVLNELGAEGWDVVTATGDEFFSAVMLKREL